MGLGVAVYLLIKFINNDIIVQPWISWYNDSIIGFLIVLCLFYALWYWIYPYFVRMQKITLLVLGILFILLGYNYLVASWPNDQFVGDIIRLFGTILVLFWATWNLTPISSIKRQEESEQEIIEV